MTDNIRKKRIFFQVNINLPEKAEVWYVGFISEEMRSELADASRISADNPEVSMTVHP